MPKAKGARGSQKSQGARAKRPQCRRCGKRIGVPAGWSAGAATRRHYWAQHRDVMLGDS